MLNMSGSTILDKNLKDRGSNRTMRVSKIKVVQGSLCVVLDQFRRRIKINVKWEIECSTNSRNTTNNISAVNGRTIPGIRSCNTSRNKYIISTAIFYCDSYTFIEESMKVFNRKPL